MVGAAAGGAIALVLGLGVSLLLRSSARGSVGELYPRLIQAATEAESLLQQALSQARARTAAQQTKLNEQREKMLQFAEQQHEARTAELFKQRDARLKAPTESVEQKKIEYKSRRDAALAEAQQLRKSRLAEFENRKRTGASQIEARYRQEIALSEEQRTNRLHELTAWWREGLAQLDAMAQEIRGLNIEGAAHAWVSDWSQVASGKWAPAPAIPSAVRFGEIRVGLEQFENGTPQLPELAAITPSEYRLPGLVAFPDFPSLLFKARGDGRRMAIEAMQAFMVRLLITLPPGKLRFTIIDPVGLGENFAGVMHLADFNEAFVTSRIWTEVPHIEQRLVDLSEHMENVIQKYLRNEYQNIEQYNREAGEIAEPYRYLVVANFPANFSEAAQRRLLSIAASGSRCGVYVLVMADTQMPVSQNFAMRDLEELCTTLVWKDQRFQWKDPHLGPYALTLDAPPAPSVVTEIVTTAGKLAAAAGKVEVPFSVIAPKPDKFWSESAASILDVPLGRAGATRFQSMKLGRGTSQHVLVAGKTGSGKSTLLHILITNAALRFSPDELELYLIDFKQGIEFKTYANYQLPHARVVAVESDREFGVSVLQRLDEEIKLRGERFKAFGAQDLAAYRKADPGTPMPRTLLVIDEFQELFTEDDKVSQDAALFLDRLVRQGRAFGIHVFLGSQTLAGAFSVSRSTLSQMAVRIALQCSEADSQLILSEDNSAARLLSRPGEAIYNDSNGMVEGNHPFQIVWLTEEARDHYLTQVRGLCEKRGIKPRSQLVFEGNMPAEMQNNGPLSKLLTAGRPNAAPHEAVVWLGDAVAIKDPTSIVFRAQSGANLLMVGQNEDAALGVFQTAMISVAAQYPLAPELCPRFYVCDGSTIGSNQSALLAQLPTVVGDPVQLVTRRQLADVINRVAYEVERRQKSNKGEDAPIYFLIHGVHKLREFWKNEDDYGFGRANADAPPDPSKQFATILKDGPPQGVYTIAWIDSVNNLNRAWERQTLREFEMRIIFQMSVNDSSSLIDSPAGAKLGQYRALFHSEETSTQEKFRPYRWPSEEWLGEVREQLGGPSRETQDILPAPPARGSSKKEEPGFTSAFDSSNDDDDDMPRLNLSEDESSKDGDKEGGGKYGKKSEEKDDDDD